VVESDSRPLILPNPPNHARLIGEEAFLNLPDPSGAGSLCHNLEGAPVQYLTLDIGEFAHVATRSSTP
jgi:hypothetical protein